MEIVSTLVTEEDVVEGLNYKFRTAVNMNKKPILFGRMIAIDPGSTRPGYAIYESGELVDKGWIRTESKHLHQRLKEVSTAISTLTEGADLLAIEKIGPFNSRTDKKKYDPLQQSIGAIHVGSQAKYMLEVKPITWQKFIGDDYVKSDDEDAVAIGNCLVVIAKELSGTED